MGFLWIDLIGLTGGEVVVIDPDLMGYFAMRCLGCNGFDFIFPVIEFFRKRAHRHMDTALSEELIQGYILAVHGKQVMPFRSMVHPLLQPLNTIFGGSNMIFTDMCRAAHKQQASGGQHRITIGPEHHRREQPAGVLNPWTRFPSVYQHHTAVGQHVTDHRELPWRGMPNIKKFSGSDGGIISLDARKR